MLVQHLSAQFRLRVSGLGERDRSSLAVRGDTTWWPSSNHAVRSYCTNCGSPLFLFEVDDPLVAEVAAGSLDAPDEIKSARQSYED